MFIVSTWPATTAPTIIVHDGLNFLLQSYRNLDSVYFWMTVLGNNSTAERYMYKLRIRKKSNASNKNDDKWTVNLKTNIIFERSSHNSVNL